MKREFFAAMLFSVFSLPRQILLEVRPSVALPVFSSILPRPTSPPPRQA